MMETMASLKDLNNSMKNHLDSSRVSCVFSWIDNFFGQYSSCFT
jgi:hypothetical protein